MSGYILCQTKRAKLPYHIENISTNIYSIEELCYYLYHNLYLIDRTLMNEGLCGWIQEELELPALAAKLRQNLGKFTVIEDFIYPIFKEINYLTYEELRALNVQLKKLDGEPAAVREKQKGDALIENGMYVNAICVYQNLLKRDDLDEAGEGLTERIYHNLGCAYSYLFQMEKAVEYFWKAYDEGHDKAALKCYLLAFRSSRMPVEYENRMKELNVSEDIRGEIAEMLNHFANLPEQQVDIRDTDELLENLTQDYHRSTGS